MKDLEQTIMSMHHAGISNAQISDALNAEGRCTQSGAHWTTGLVRSRIWWAKQKASAVGRQQPLKSAYIPTSREIDYEAARVNAMSDLERYDWETAKAVREREKAADERRRARLKEEVARLRREAEELGRV